MPEKFPNKWTGKAERRDTFLEYIWLEQGL